MKTIEITNQIATLPWNKHLRWSPRKLTRIDRIIIHQELGDAPVAAVNNYHINPNHISPRGCPHFCYHYGIEKSGEIIQANILTDVTWHTTGQNTTGIGIMLVGNFSGPGHETSNPAPSTEQFTALTELCEYLLQAFALDWNHVYGHCDFGKKACPGYAVEEWIKERKKEVK